MLMDLLKKRRSIRKYIDKPIPKEDLLKCLEAARLAPSACNGQPWKFIIVDEPSLKNSLCEKAFSGIYSINKFVRNASALIVAVSEKEKFFSAIGAYLRGTNFYLLDIGIACEHLVLQAAELGIGTCWIGWFDEKAVKGILNVPETKRIDVIISLGYYEEGKLPEKIRKSLNEISSFNTYK